MDSWLILVQIGFFFAEDKSVANRHPLFILLYNNNIVLKKSDSFMVQVNWVWEWWWDNLLFLIKIHFQVQNNICCVYKYDHAKNYTSTTVWIDFYMKNIFSAPQKKTRIRSGIHTLHKNIMQFLSSWFSLSLMHCLYMSLHSALLILLTCISAHIRTIYEGCNADVCGR